MKLRANCRKSTGALTQNYLGLRLPDCGIEIVHDYFGLDLEIIWEIIRGDLPDLEKQVRALQI